MKNIKVWKIRYQQTFAAFFALALTFVMVKSLGGGLSDFDAGLYGRRKLILNFANLRLALGDRVFPNVVVGKDGWMFLSAERAMEDYQGGTQFSPEQLAELSARLWELNNRLAARGAKLIVLIIPNKQTIYADKIPAELGPLAPNSRLAQFYAENARSGPPVLMDVRPLLAQGRKTREVYLRTDTHWNNYGAFLAYQAILQRLKPDFPALEIRPESDFLFRQGTPLPGDLLKNTGGNLNPENYLVLEKNFSEQYGFRELELGGDHQVTVTWRADAPQLPRLLMFHDSFGFELRFLLAESFSKATFVPHFSGQQVWNLNWIEQENPDVVIIEFTERYLDSLPLFLGK
ncbi:MAG: hypothetical protein Fur0035_06050 [Anaerolineales bacterium]